MCSLLSDCQLSTFDIVYRNASTESADEHGDITDRVTDYDRPVQICLHATGHFDDDLLRLMLAAGDAEARQTLQMMRTAIQKKVTKNEHFVKKKK